MALHCMVEVHHEQVGGHRHLRGVVRVGEEGVGGASGVQRSGGLEREAASGRSGGGKGAQTEACHWDRVAGDAGEGAAVVGRVGGALAVGTKVAHCGGSQ